MSLAIDVDTVAAVLLADGWYEVLNESFSLDSYEFVWSGMDGVKVKDLRKPEHRRDTGEPLRAMTMHSGGTGFAFQTRFESRGIPEGSWISGPLSAILAVQYT